MSPLELFIIAVVLGSIFAVRRRPWVLGCAILAVLVVGLVYAARVSQSALMSPEYRYVEDGEPSGAASVSLSETLGRESIHDRLEAYPTTRHDRLEAYPTARHDRLEAYPTANPEITSASAGELAIDPDGPDASVPTEPRPGLELNAEIGATEDASGLMVPDTPTMSAESPPPDWVVHPPQDEDIVIVSTDPMLSLADARWSLHGKIREAVQLWTTEHLLPAPWPRWIKINDRDISALGKIEKYDEVVQLEVGPMRRVHARLHFNKDFLEYWDRRMEQMTVARRMTVVGGVSGGLLVGVGALFAVLKFVRVS